MSAVVVAIGATRALPADIRLELGAQHPTQQGGMLLRLTVDDGIITSADPAIGFVHRSAERLFEARDYRQLMMLANRHDWVGAFSAELGIALTLEDVMGIVPPERATWTRMLLAETNRVTASLLMLGSSFTALHDLLHAREQLLEPLERLTGSRVHPMFTRIGGIARACPEDWLRDLTVLVTALRSTLGDLVDRTAGECGALVGVGVITRAAVDDYGLSGTAARASGAAIDLRLQEPYLAYSDVMHDEDAGVVTSGDIAARFTLVARQVDVSLRIMGEAIAWLLAAGPGATDVPLPKVVRAPEITAYGRIEGPLGIMGVLLDSIGEKTPWRLKLRTPSFAMIQSFETTLVGLPIEHLARMLQSCTYMVGDADR
ncbi:MAG: hypothetical protein PHU75_00350 [Candidatus Nanopelagicales bacterium]|nr:hypothetical protein [Candidatus Nanopelagicales bacterium]